MGMRRRFKEEEFEMHNEFMHAALESEIRGQLSLYGRRHTYMRLKQCRVPRARDRMYQILSALDPIGVANRAFAQQRIPQTDFSVAGPNEILSVDGHHKLSLYGIEIYAGIDAYSRYL
jgi:hypothetical protein